LIITGPHHGHKKGGKIGARRGVRREIGGFFPPFIQKFFNFLGFLRKRPEIPTPPPIFAYRKFENPPLPRRISGYAA